MKYKYFKANYLYGKRSVIVERLPNGDYVYSVSKYDPVIPEWRIRLAYILAIFKIAS